MTSKRRARKTTVGAIDPDVLAFTVGADPELDLALVEPDCIGTAAHVTMLARVPVKPRLLSAGQRTKVIRALVAIIEQARNGAFKITVADQDVHLAVERVLTAKLGDLGKRVHTARSRNDQVAVDLRLYAKGEVAGVVLEAEALALTLLKLARRHVQVPMVGRTHMQPAMPSSVGLWASAHAESLCDDMMLLSTAYQLNDRCPLGSAAGYGVPLPIDPVLTARLLGFEATYRNVLYANNARGKLESIVLDAMAQVMGSLARLAQDLILYTMPEFSYFSLPAEYCTGSSIMPQKRNPDVCELIRAKASTVSGQAQIVRAIVKAVPTGYNRDLQETKGPFMTGMATTRASLRIMAKLVTGLAVNRKALLDAFTPDVFAADQALKLVAKGLPFRDAYDHVKTHMDELEGTDPRKAIADRAYPGAAGGLDVRAMSAHVKGLAAGIRKKQRCYHRAVAKLLGVKNGKDK